MPAATSDRRLLVLTGGAVVIAALLFAGVLLLATRHNAGTPSNQPLFLGLEHAKIEEIRNASPQYIANPFGGDGFWLDVENGKLVALVLDRPGEKHCQVKWKAQQDAYLDCHANAVTSRELARYKVTVGSRNGSPAQSVFVNLRKVLPAPQAPSSGG
jgi:hypothetical protein